MNRNEKLCKLGSAIAAWRGATNAQTGKWIRPPEEKAVFRVAKWLTRLGRKDIDGDIATIQNFKTYNQFYDWFRSL